MTPNPNDKKLHKTDWLGNIGCLGLVLLVLAWGGVIYNGVHNSLKPSTLTVKAETTVSQNTVTLKNDDNFDWTNIYFGLDTDNDSTTIEYSYYLDIIKAQETVTLDLTKFTSNSQAYFDPALEQPKHLSFFAQTNQRTGQYLYTWP